MTRLAAHSPLPPDAPLRTGLAKAILSEAARKLTSFAESGQPDAVDLAGLPMTPADFEDMDAALGRGEVEITLNVAGTTEIWETAYPGLWRVRHCGAEAKITSQELLITRIPEIVMTHMDDCRAAAIRLETDITARDS